MKLFIKNHYKKLFLIVFALSVFNTNLFSQQSGKHAFMSISPAFELIQSQIIIYGYGGDFGFGYYNGLRLYLYGNVGYRYGQSPAEPSLRATHYQKFTPSFKMKVQLFGNNIYQ